MSPNIPPLPNLQPAAKNETLSIVHGIYAGLLVLVRLHFYIWNISSRRFPC